MTVMTMVPEEELNSYFIQVAVAMLAGVWYVGAFLNWVQGKMVGFWDRHRRKER